MVHSLLAEECMSRALRAEEGKETKVQVRAERTDMVTFEERKNSREDLLSPTVGK